MKRSRETAVAGLGDADLAELLEEHSPYLQLNDEGRVRCTLNGHVMPARRQAIESFVNGAKYQRLRQRDKEAAGFAAYKPFLIDSKNYKNKLYCALTCMLLNRSSDSIRKHMKGKAFLKAKEKYEKKEHELMEEPDLEDSSEPSEGAAEPGQAGEILAEMGAMELDSQGRDGVAASDEAADPMHDSSAPSSHGASKSPKMAKNMTKKKKKKKAGKGPGAFEASQPQTPPQQPSEAGSKEDKAAWLSRRTKAGKTVPKKPKKEAC